MDFIRNLSLGICLFLTAIFIWKEETTIGSFVMVYNVANQVTANLSAFFNKLSNIDDFGIYLSDWKKLSDLKEENNSTKVCQSDFAINFSNVCFHYPMQRNDILKDINLEINSGEKIAIIGENGSGKSSFINLILGLYKPTSGSIFISKDNIEDVLLDYRKKTSCIFQNFNKYQISIKENICIGGFEKDICINSYPQIFNLIPEKFSTNLDINLGQLDKDAVEISGGEWQKLALARALLRTDSEIIVMDEPTSSLDSIAEESIINDLMRHYSDKTFIIISHRFALSSFCNRFIVFDKGMIVEDGSHDELMARKGKYYDLYKSQSEFFSH